MRIAAEGFSTVAEGPFHEILVAGERAVTRLGDGSRLAWLDLETGEIVLEGSGLGRHVTTFLPLADGGIWLAVGYGEDAQHRRYDRDLALTETLTDRALQLVERDGALVGSDWEGRLWMRQAGEERFTRLGEPAGLAVEQIVALPEGLATAEGRLGQPLATFHPFAGLAPEEARIDAGGAQAAERGRHLEISAVAGAALAAALALAAAVAAGRGVWSRRRR